MKSTFRVILSRCVDEYLLTAVPAVGRWEREMEFPLFLPAGKIITELEQTIGIRRVSPHGVSEFHPLVGSRLPPPTLFDSVRRRDEVGW